MIIRYIFIFIILSLLAVSGCGKQDENNVTEEDGQTTEGVFYNCQEGDISIEGTTVVQDNERNEYSVELKGKLLCKTEPMTGAKVNVKFPERNTNLDIKTNEAGEFSVKLSRLKESPSGKEFTVSLMTEGKSDISKVIKVQ